MRFAFIFFGWEICAFEVSTQRFVSDVDTDEEELTPELVGGGSAGSYERDLEPPEPIFSPEWEEDQSGFGFKS